MLTSRFFKAVRSRNPIAIATLASGLIHPVFPSLVITPLLLADAVIEPSKALARYAKRRAEQRAAVPPPVPEQPKLNSKQERLDTLNAELSDNLRMIDLALIPDEDKAALRNRETDLYQAKFRRILEG